MGKIGKSSNTDTKMESIVEKYSSELYKTQWQGEKKQNKQLVSTEQSKQ